MWDRRFLFTDDKVIEQLKSFIPVVGNTHDWQTNRHDVGKWFMSTVAKVNPRADQGETTQGFYVIGADGSAYGFNNNRSIDRVQSFMETGLKAFREKPPVKVDIPDAPDMQRQPPDGTTILRIYSRIKPMPLGADTTNENVQRDHFWLLPDEVQALTQAGPLKGTLPIRFCRFALVDAIRGEPDFWTAKEVNVKNFRVTALAAGKYKVAGRFAMETSDRSRGAEGTLEAEVSISDGRVSDFKGYVSATAWGKGTYTPNPPKGKFPLKFAIVLAPKTPDAVAPQAAFFGPEYLKG